MSSDNLSSLRNDTCVNRSASDRILAWEAPPGQIIDEETLERFMKDGGFARMDQTPKTPGWQKMPAVNLKVFERGGRELELRAVNQRMASAAKVAPLFEDGVGPSKGKGKAAAPLFDEGIRPSKGKGKAAAVGSVPMPPIEENQSVSELLHILNPSRRVCLGDEEKLDAAEKLLKYTKLTDEEIDVNHTISIINTLNSNAILINCLQSSKNDQLDVVIAQVLSNIHLAKLDSVLHTASIKNRAFNFARSIFFILNYLANRSPSVRQTISHMLNELTNVNCPESKYFNEKKVRKLLKRCLKDSYKKNPDEVVARNISKALKNIEQNLLDEKLLKREERKNSGFCC